MFITLININLIYIDYVFDIKYYGKKYIFLFYYTL